MTTVHLRRLFTLLAALGLCGSLSSCVLVLGKHDKKSKHAIAIEETSGESASEAMATAEDETEAREKDATAEAAAAATDAKAEKKARAKRRKRESLERRLRYARIELQIADISAEEDLRKAELTLDDARRELEEAREKLAKFQNHDRPRKLERSTLSLDRSAHYREIAEDELRELEAMYEAEDFAETTKELVLKRGRRQLEFATRSLQLDRQQRELLESFELPHQERELHLAVEKAERGVHEAEVGLQKTRLRTQLSLLKARSELEDLERKLEEGDEDDGDDE